MSPYEILFAAFAFILGSCIGSFLNVCIYRMPRDMKVNEPARSFCPGCKYQIPFYHNLPLLSWLALRGKCANCGTKISFRYIGVELITGLLFLAVWLLVWPHHWLLALPLWIMVSLFIAATFIDFEHYIIPDEITWGGAIAGIVMSFALPALHGAKSNLEGAMWALIGAAVGYGTLRLVVELGKLAFGRKRITFDKATDFTWTRHDDDADLVVGGDSEKWSEFFARDSDRLLMECQSAKVDGEAFENVTLEFHFDRLQIGEKTWQLMEIATITGTVKLVTIPREAMGLGDVKFMACVGAFLGWKAVFFTIMAASTIGAVIGLVTIAVGKREWSAKIPFGPYLALGALIWLFTGPQLIDWYLAYVAGVQ